MFLSTIEWYRNNAQFDGDNVYIDDKAESEFINNVQQEISKRIYASDVAIVTQSIISTAQQRAHIEYLEYQLRSPLRMFSDLNAISRHDDNNYNIQKPLQVKYHYGTDNEFIDEVRLNPEEVVCVLSFAKDRRRRILERKEHSDKPPSFNTYVLYTQTLSGGKKLNFDTLRAYLDPWEHNLVATSNAIVNASYYYFDGSDLKLNLESNGIDSKFQEIILNKRGADKRDIHNLLIRCKENKRNYYNSLQNMSSFYNFYRERSEG